MKFIYSVIGDNTQENREWLEKVGYKVNHSSDDRFLRTYEDGSTKISHFKNWIYEDKQPINCIGNPQLFQAVSAISTKTDIGKHYVNNHTGQWRQCTYEMATDENIDWNDWTEASLEELQEHFK